MTTPVATIDTTAPVDESAYHAFLDEVQARFTRLAAGQPLFAVDVDGADLWRAYLDAIPEHHRQHSTCHACRRFVEQFGNVVLIADTGHLTSPIWNPAIAPPEVGEAVLVVSKQVERARVNGIFLSSERQWGTPVTGVWRHLAVVPPATTVYRAGVLTASQRMAELREDHRCLQLALSEFLPPALAQARTILEAEALARSERFLGVVTWLEARHADRQVKDARLRANRLWRAVVSAPAGFCKPRASMVGSLLEDLISGMAFDDVKRRFDAKMHPLQYQRPQAPPAAGNIRQAEETIAKLGLEAALSRRFATLGDVQEWVWRPRVERESSAAGVFGHLQPKGKAAPSRLTLPAQTLTWVKFRDSVLPTAERVEFHVPAQSSAFSAFVTAADAEAPPLLQWDREDARNPVSWYFYHGATPAAQWGLAAGAWVPVLGVTPKPNLWNGSPATHHGEGVMFVVEGARDSRNDSLALFPETLRNELHGVRATLEAHSRSRKLQPVEGQLASGILLGKGSEQGWGMPQFRVTNAGATTVYRLDRWD